MYDFHRCRTNGRPTPSSGPHRVRKGSICVFTKIGSLRSVRTSFELLGTDSAPSKNVKYRFLMRFQRCEKRFKRNVIYTMQGASRMFLFDNWGRAWTPQFFVLDRVVIFHHSCDYFNRYTVNGKSLKIVATLNRNIKCVERER